MLKAKDLMRKDVITVSPGMEVEELGRLFIEKNVSGFPVVDKDGKLIGIVTENDLITTNKRLHIPTMIRIWDAIIPLEGSDVVEKEIRKMTGTTVSDICTREVVAINEETPLDEIATIMTEKRIHLLPVMSGVNIIGIVGRHEVIEGISR